MNAQAIEMQERKDVGIEKWQKPDAIIERLRAIQDLMKQALKEDVDFGRIPGMPKDSKPCLLKPGSEQIMTMFRIAVEPTVEDLSTEDCFRYRVITRMTDQRTGEFLGAGVGEASSNETKFKWRRTYSEKEYAAMKQEGRARIKYSQYKDQRGAWVDREEMQVRQEPADVANTVLKIAKKRSQIDGTLTVTGASSMFEQDTVDEMTEETQAAMKEAKGPRGKFQKAEDVICASCGAANGHQPDCKFANTQEKAQEKKQPKPEAKTAKPEPRTDTGPKPGPQKYACILKEAARKQTADGKREYWQLRVLTSDNQDLWVYSWHINTGYILRENGIGKPCLVMIEEKTSSKGPYLSLEDVLEIDGVEYTRDKDGRLVRGETQPAEKAGEDW